MSGLRITRTPPDFPYMRSQSTHSGNNKSTISEFHPNAVILFMLFYRSNTNIREFIVIYVLN